MTTIIKPGTDLILSELAFINEWREKEFGEILTWDKEHIEWYGFRTVFLVYKENELVSFGNLRPLKVSFQDEVYPVWGVAAVVSIVKGKGYGRELMESMISFASEKNEMIIGFCEEKNIGFYNKTGFKTIKHGGSYVAYQNVEGELHPYENPYDVLLVFDPTGNFINHIEALQHRKIVILL